MTLAVFALAVFALAVLAFAVLAFAVLPFAVLAFAVLLLPDETHPGVFLTDGALQPSDPRRFGKGRNPRRSKYLRVRKVTCLTSRWSMMVNSWLVHG